MSVGEGASRSGVPGMVDPSRPAPRDSGKAARLRRYQNNFDPQVIHQNYFDDTEST
jgi:hypothetical protein